MGRFRLLSYVHPHLFQFGRLVLPTYGFLVALGTILSLLVCVRTARLLSLDTDKIWSVALLAIVTALVGGRILLNLLRWPQVCLRRRTGRGRDRMHGVPMPCISASPSGEPRMPLPPAWRWGVRSRPSPAWKLDVTMEHRPACPGPWSSAVRLPCPELRWECRCILPSFTPSLVQFVLFVFLLWLLHRPHYDGEILGAWLFLGGLSSFLLTLLRGDGVLATQLVSAVMVLGGGLLWLRRRHQVSHGG